MGAILFLTGIIVFTCQMVIDSIQLSKLESLNHLLQSNSETFWDKLLKFDESNANTNKRMHKAIESISKMNESKVSYKLNINDDIDSKLTDNEKEMYHTIAEENYLVRDINGNNISKNTLEQKIRNAFSNRFHRTLKELSQINQDLDAKASGTMIASIFLTIATLVVSPRMTSLVFIASGIVLLDNWLLWFHDFSSTDKQVTTFITDTRDFIYNSIEESNLAGSNLDANISFDKLTKNLQTINNATIGNDFTKEGFDFKKQVQLSLNALSVINQTKGAIKLSFNYKDTSQDYISAIDAKMKAINNSFAKQIGILTKFTNDKDYIRYITHSNDDEAKKVLAKLLNEMSNISKNLTEIAIPFTMRIALIAKRRYTYDNLRDGNIHRMNSDMKNTYYDSLLSTVSEIEE